MSDGLYTYMGSDDPDVPGNNGSPNGNVFSGNLISAVDIGVHIKEAEDNTFSSEFLKSVLQNLSRLRSTFKNSFHWDRLL